MRIAFENLPENFPSPNQLRNWLQSVAQHHRVVLGQVAYRFVDGTTMLSMNQRYLQHDTDTDILTFDYSKGGICSYEAIINLEMLAHNAATFSQSAENELIRLLSHAFLHVLGLNDKRSEEKEVMRAAEEEAIAMFHVKHTSDV